MQGALLDAVFECQVERLQVALGLPSVRDVGEGHDHAGDPVLLRAIGEHPLDIPAAVVRKQRLLQRRQIVKHGVDARDQVTVVEAAGEVANRPPAVAWEQAEQVGGGRREPLDAVLTVDAQRRDFGAGQQIVEIVVGVLELAHLRLELSVDRAELLIERLQLLPRRLQFLVRGLQFLVDGHHLLVRHPGLLERRLELFEAGLEIAACDQEVVLELTDNPRFGDMWVLARHAKGSGLLLEDDEAHRARLPIGHGQGQHGEPHRVKRAPTLDAKVSDRHGRIAGCG